MQGDVLLFRFNVWKGADLGCTFSHFLVLNQFCVFCVQPISCMVIMHANQKFCRGSTGTLWDGVSSFWVSCTLIVAVALLLSCGGLIRAWELILHINNDSRRTQSPGNFWLRDRHMSPWLVLFSLRLGGTSHLPLLSICLAVYRWHHCQCVLAPHRY